jgi:hypothetical protein
LKRAISYTDAQGRSHNTPESATVSDLRALFPKDPEGVAVAFAQKILENRPEIERIFKEFDEATQPEV